MDWSGLESLRYGNFTVALRSSAAHLFGREVRGAFKVRSGMGYPRPQFRRSRVVTVGFAFFHWKSMLLNEESFLHCFNIQPNEQDQKPSRPLSEFATPVRSCVITASCSSHGSTCYMIARRTNEALKACALAPRSVPDCGPLHAVSAHVAPRDLVSHAYGDPCRPRLPTSLFSWHSNINVAHPFPPHTLRSSADAHRHCTLPPAQEHPAQYSERPVPPPQEQSRASSGAIAPSSRRGRGGKGSTNGIAWRWSSRCRAPCTSPKLLPLGAARRLLAAARARDRRHTHT